MKNTPKDEALNYLKCLRKGTEDSYDNFIGYMRREIEKGGLTLRHRYG